MNNNEKIPSPEKGVEEKQKKGGREEEIKEDPREVLQEVSANIQEIGEDGEKRDQKELLENNFNKASESFESLTGLDLTETAEGNALREIQEEDEFFGESGSDFGAGIGRSIDYCKNKRVKEREEGNYKEEILNNKWESLSDLDRRIYIKKSKTPKEAKEEFKRDQKKSLKEKKEELEEVVGESENTEKARYSLLSKGKSLDIKELKKNIKEKESLENCFKKKTKNQLLEGYNDFNNEVTKKIEERYKKREEEYEEKIKNQKIELLKKVAEKDKIKIGDNSFFIGEPIEKKKIKGEVTGGNEDTIFIRNKEGKIEKFSKEEIKEDKENQEKAGEKEQREEQTEKIEKNESLESVKKVWEEIKSEKAEEVKNKKYNEAEEPIKDITKESLKERSKDCAECEAESKGKKVLTKKEFFTKKRQKKEEKKILKEGMKAAWENLPEKKKKKYIKKNGKEAKKQALRDIEKKRKKLEKKLGEKISPKAFYSLSKRGIEVHYLKAKKGKIVLKGGHSKGKSVEKERFLKQAKKEELKVGREAVERLVNKYKEGRKNFNNRRKKHKKGIIGTVAEGKKVEETDLSFGSKAKIKRISGEIEDDWVISSSVEGDSVFVVKEINGKKHSKMVSKEVLINLNKKEEEQQPKEEEPTKNKFKVRFKTKGSEEASQPEGVSEKTQENKKDDSIKENPGETKTKEKRNENEGRKEDEGEKEELPQDQRSLHRYFIVNFDREFEGTNLEEFKNKFTQEKEEKFREWAKHYIEAKIKEKPSELTYPDTVAGVLGNNPDVFQRIVSSKENEVVEMDKILKMPFSDAAKKYLGIDLPKNYFNHFSKR